MSDPRLVVLFDNNIDTVAKSIAVYVDGKKVDAKVLGWWSDDEWPSLFNNHIFVTCYGPDGANGCSDDYHVELPDQWTSEEWEALTRADGWMVP